MPARTQSSKRESKRGQMLNSGGSAKTAHRTNVGRAAAADKPSRAKTKGDHRG